MNSKKSRLRLTRLFIYGFLSLFFFGWG